MAQQGVEVHQERACCSKCLGPVSGPASGSCGHSCCRRCIDQHRTQDDQRGTSGCGPQCTTRTVIPTVLVPNRNTTMDEVVEQSQKKTPLLPAEVTENLKTTELLPDVPPAPCYAGPGDVACDSCSGRRLKAVKTCLQCLVSYCDAHLRPHYQSAAFQKHRLVSASPVLQESAVFCSRHDEAKKVFCRTDQQCICYLCSMDQHRGHDTVSAATERAERQRELAASRQEVQRRIQEREEDADALCREVESINFCADRAVEHSDAVFRELVSSVERRRSEVKELIREQQRRQVSRADEQRRRAEQEVAGLRRRCTELEQLELTKDHVHFLHGFTSSLLTIRESADGSHSPPLIRESAQPAGSHSPPLIRESAQPAGSHSPPPSRFHVSNVRFKPEDILRELETLVSETVSRVDAFLPTTPMSPPPPEPRTRAEFLRYSRPIALDPNTVEAHLTLSRDNKKVRRTMSRQSYPQHPERFTKCRQVLSREALSGRCYWEVKWTGYNVYIAVSYRDISRTGLFNESGFGYTDSSWSLQCYDEEYVFRHGSMGTVIPGPVSSRVGVYLDHSAGLLSFYGVSDTMTLLHRVHTTFTHSLHPGFYVSSFIGATAELCDLGSSQ